MNWTVPPKPAEITEERIIDAILEGHFPVSSNLPAERELAIQLGITRPTLREALQRLACDGWIEIRHGRPTRVRDYWHEGSLGVLGAIARRTQHIPEDFIPNLLQVRILLAPAYTRLAVERDADQVIANTAAFCPAAGYRRTIRRVRLAAPSQPDRRFWESGVHIDPERLSRALPADGMPVFSGQ